MKIFNTLTREKELFTPLEEGKVKIYLCGPTVYNFFHLGNARPFVTFDTLRRYLQYLGYEVQFVQNFTDIDDKMIQEANTENILVQDLADRYISEYFIDAEGLNIMKATYHPRATETISEMIALIQDLMDKGYAYIAEDGVYFAVRKFPAYAKLSKFNLDDLIQNARKDLSERSGKQDAVDFVMWKFKKAGEPFWPSPWGDGRPGWHIECSAMVKKYLGETIDIHCGGQDLIFPHHENEIAQSEAANEKTFVHYWMHNGFITVDDQKMSKSEGNFFTVREIAKVYGYMPIRLFLLNSHYRSPINYSIDLMEQFKHAYERMETCWKNIQFQLAQGKESTDVEQSLRIDQAIKHTIQGFEAAMNDDMNTADALGKLFDFIRQINVELQEVKDHEALAKASSTLEKLLYVLGIHFEWDEEIPQEIKELVEKRQLAKQEKNYALADKLRDEVQNQGYIITDTPQGPKIEKK